MGGVATQPQDPGMYETPHVGWEEDHDLTTLHHQTAASGNDCRLEQ